MGFTMWDTSLAVSSPRCCTGNESTNRSSTGLRNLVQTNHMVGWSTLIFRSTFASNPLGGNSFGISAAVLGYWPWHPNGLHAVTGLRPTQSLASGPCTHWPPVHAVTGLGPTQSLASGPHGHWPPAHAVTGLRPTQSLASGPRRHWPQAHAVTGLGPTRSLASGPRGHWPPAHAVTGLRPTRSLASGSCSRWHPVFQPVERVRMISWSGLWRSSTVATVELEHTRLMDGI